MMRVRADYDLCESNAVCAGLVPQVFEVDDEDNLNILVTDIPPELEGQVRHAVRSCPKTALSLTDNEDNPIDA
jgi:ferredoxin